VTSDWVTGQASSTEQDSPYTTHLSTWHTAVFAQDNYRITPRFTANLGVRWDIDTPPTDSHDRTESFIPGQQSTVAPLAPKGLVFPGDAGVGRGIIPTSTTTFAAYRLCVGSVWRRQDLRFAAARASFTGLLPERMEPARQRHSLRAAATEPAKVPLSSITNYYSTPGDFPSTAPVAASSVQLHAEQACIHLRPRRSHRNHLPALQVSIRSTSSIFPCSDSCPAG